MDTGTAEILSGDFAHDAILTKAEQLAKQEVCEAPYSSRNLAKAR